MFLLEPVPELFAQLAQETYSTDLLHLLVVHIARFDFEARKDVVQIFNNLLRRQIGARWPTVEYISGKREVLFAALDGYENEDVALNTGMILREMLRHEPLCKILLYSEQFAFIYAILLVLAIDHDIFIGCLQAPAVIQVIRQDLPESDHTCSFHVGGIFQVHFLQ